MKNVYYITLPVDSSATKALPINQNDWDKFVKDVIDLTHPHVIPHNLELKGHKHQGSPLIDSNVISISPQEDKGGDLVIKRNGDKAFIKIKTQDEAYATVLGAILLALKRRIPEVIISNKLHLIGMQKAIDYFNFVMEAPAPSIYAAMAEEVVVTFKWLDNLHPEDAEQVLEDIRAILSGNADDVYIRFKSSSQ